MKIAVSILFALIFCFGLPVCAQTAGRKDLEPVLMAHLAAGKAGDMNAVLATLATSEIAEMRNICLSRKESFPPALPKDSDARRMLLVPFKSLNFVGLKQNGPHAILIYFREGVDDGLGEKVDEFFVVDFVHEKEGWKFLRASRNHDERRAAKLKAGDLSFLNEPEFTPSATIPPVPPEVTRAEYVAYIDFFALAQKVVVTVNGVPYEMTANNGSRLVMGGLKKGNNTIRVEYQPVPGKIDAGGSKVRIKVMGSYQKPLQAWVYKWNDTSGKHEATLVMDDAKLAKLPAAQSFY